MSRAGTAAAALVAAGLVLSAPPARAAGQRLDLAAGLTTTYDTNLLQYSDSQLELFESGRRPDRFSLETLDDLVAAPDLALTWQLDSGRGRRHVLRARGSAALHDKNGTADYRSLSLSWREFFRGRRRISLGLYAVPHYYLRQLLAEDVVPLYPGLSRERRAEFALDIASASFRQRAWRELELELGYRLERRRYNREFRERDSFTHEGELLAGIARQRGSLEARLLYRASVARAADGDEAPGVNDDPDLGYRGPGGGLGGRIDLAALGPLRAGADLDLDLESRRFGSTRPFDTYHFGRRDLLLAVETGLRIQLHRASARAFWHYESNDAHLGTRAPLSGDAGSYRQHQVGLALDVSASVWRSPAAPDHGTEE